MEPRIRPFLAERSRGKSFSEPFDSKTVVYVHSKGKSDNSSAAKDKKDCPH